MEEIFNQKTILFMALGLLVFLTLLYIGWRSTRKPKIPRRLKFIFYSLTNKTNFTMPNSGVLTDLLKHTFVAQATDANGNVYQGTIAFTSVSPADPSQDSASADSTVPNTIDVNAVSNTGGTVVNVAGNFTSQGNSTPAPGSTAAAIPDGTVIPGTGTLTLTNNVPTGTTPPPIPTSMTFTFTQAS